MDGVSQAFEGSGLFICSFTNCTKGFKKKSRLTHHLMTHTGDRPFICSEANCGKTYVRSAHLKRHRETSHSKQPPVLNSHGCTEEGCDKVFSSQYSLNKHLRTVHKGEPQHKCGEAGCTEAFRKRCQLRAHLFWHQGVLPFQCDQPQCLMKFAQKSHLERHKKIHQGYKCTEEDCTEIFAKFSQLIKHREVHRKQQVNICPTCQKTFPRPIILQRHFQSHSDGQDVNKCPKPGCNRFYMNMRNLNAHIRSYHEGRRFPCEMQDCGKTFATKQKLQEHQKLHDPQIPKKQRKGHHKGGARKHHIVTKLTGVPKSSLTAVTLTALGDRVECDLDTDIAVSHSHKPNHVPTTNQETCADHVTSDNVHLSVIEACNVIICNDHVISRGGHMTLDSDQVTPEGEHVTSEGDHVTPEGDHVTPECDHVTPECDHVTPEGDHVTSDNNPMILEISNLAADNSSSDDQTSLYIDHVTMIKYSPCCSEGGLDSVCDQIQDTNIAHSPPCPNSITPINKDILHVLSEKTL